MINSYLIFKGFLNFLNLNLTKHLDIYNVQDKKDKTSLTCQLNDRF